MRISAVLPGTRASARSPKRFRRLWLLIPLIALAIGAVVIWRMRTSATTTSTTSTAAVSQGTITATVSGSGSVAAARSVDLSFQQSSTITAVNVAIGDTA